MFRPGRSRSSMHRLFFATDLHGSTLAFRKFLSAPRFYSVDTLVLGGDLTGKRIIAVADEPERVDQAVVERAEREGAYLWASSDEDQVRLRHPEHERDIFTRLALERVQEWLARAEKVLAETGTRCFLIPGNDDPPEIAAALTTHEGALVQTCDERVVDMGAGYCIGGLGFSNPTPWGTPRELTEAQLAERLTALAAQCREPQRTILNIHVPPHGTLDICPLLDTSVDPPRPMVRGGEPVTGSVGSTAVRDFLLELSPPLALCGHVHEAYGARRLNGTLVVNGGSEYGDGTLRGALIQLTDGKPSGYQLTSG